MPRSRVRSLLHSFSSLDFGGLVGEVDGGPHSDGDAHGREVGGGGPAPFASRTDLAGGQALITVSFVDDEGRSGRATVSATVN